MSFFGTPYDLLENLANEIDATARLYPEAASAMEYLANQLMSLSPLYRSLCRYCDEDEATATDLRYLHSTHKDSHEFR